MAIIDDRTLNRRWPKPNPANDLADDVYRLIETLDGIDLDMKGALEAIAGKANSAHTHGISDVAGLQNALNGKAAVDHVHGLGDLTDVDVSTSTSGQYIRRVGNQWVPSTPQVSHVDGLQAALDLKQALSERNQPNGYAGLGADGKIDQLLLPGIAITSRHVVSSEAAMLALAVQEGDLAIRTDVNETFVMGPGSPAVLANWQKLLSPTANVTSVAGKTGAVSLAVSDISGAAPSANPTLTGTVTLPAFAGANTFAAGSGDGGTIVTHNVRLKLHWGLGISGYDNVVRGAFDARTGWWTVTGGYSVNGNAVWHAGNFNPATKANLTGANYSGGVELTFGDPSLWFHHPNVKRARWVVDSGGALLWQDQGGQAHFFVTGGGRPWFQEFGYVSDYVNQRANDWSAARRDEANNYAASLHNSQTGEINERVHRIRMVGYGEFSGTGGMVHVQPGVVIGAAGTAYGAHTFGYRTLQMHINSQGGWVNIWVE